jgi:hypothetical protein
LALPLILPTHVPLEVVSDQRGHASIHVNKNVYVQLLRGARQKTSKGMEELLDKG